MSSFVRNLQRKRNRAKPEYVARDQVTVDLPDGGYMTLHPTKGWMKVSAKRLRGQFLMGEFQDAAMRTAAAIASRPKRAARNYSTVKPVPEGRVTRQQTRAALRGYVHA